MADSAVNSLIQNLENFALDNTKLVLEAEINVHTLVAELKQLKSFLRDASDKQIQSEDVKEMVKMIRNAIYAAEDAIESYMIEAGVRKARNSVQKAWNIGPHVLKLRNTAAQINDLLIRVKEIFKDRQSGLEAWEREDSALETTRKKPPVVDEDIAVGIDEVVETLIARLNGGTPDLQIITVLGMGGLGKTTLLKKVWNHPNIKHEFSTFCWVYVSKEYEPKELYLSILKKVNKQVSSYIMSLSEEELVEEVRKTLTWKYLIVLDDVWKGKDWDTLKKAFPDLKNGSKILLSSRNYEVAEHTGREGKPHQLHFLTDDQSLELLRVKVLGHRGNFPKELKDIACQIAVKCCGLPLAILVIAGVLQQSINRRHWVTVAKSVNACVSMKAEECMDVLALSYHNLPYDLRALFLYLGVFRGDSDIPAWILIRLWMAEGLIQKLGNVDVSHVAGNLELEEIANIHLEDFARRNLVIVVRRSSTGQIKTCRVHKMLCDLCVNEAEKQNFFHVVKTHSSPSSSASSSDSDYRRLCIHSDILDYILSKPSGKHSRSFLCFPEKEANIPNKNIPFISDSFKFARVLHTHPINFPSYPGKLSQLVLLRYLAISGNFSSIPQALSSFGDLQTLIVKSTSRTINIEADISGLSQLRHFHTNVASSLCQPVADENTSTSNLQTLSLITPESCTEAVLGRTPYLKKLGIRGNLSLIVEEKGGSGFDVISKLKHLERLKLLNEVPSLHQLEDQLSSLPPPSRFPQTLNKLTMSETMLHWRHISVLALLPQLQVLKLIDNAFVGDTWNSTAAGFPSLRVLQIRKTDLAFWNGSTTDHFPVLETIVLKKCTSLQRFPSGMGDAHSTVEIIDLSHCSSAAVVSATKIQEEREKTDAGSNPLKLVVYPPRQ